MPKLIGVGVVGVHVCRFPNASAHIKSRTLPTMPTRGRTIINFQTIKHKERWFLGPRRETDTPMTLNKFFLFFGPSKSRVCLRYFRGARTQRKRQLMMPGWVPWSHSLPLSVARVPFHCREDTRYIHLPSHPLSKDPVNPHLAAGPKH